MTRRQTTWDLRKFALVAIVGLSLLLLFLQRAYAANRGDATAAGADFHLQPTSGLIGAGVVLPQVTNDFYDNLRPATGYSVGAAQ